MKAATRLLCSLGLFLAIAVDSNAAVTGTVRTIGGSFTPGYRDGSNLESLFNQPNGLAIDSLGRVLVADFANNAVRYITADEVAHTLTTSNVSGPIAIAPLGNGDVLVVNYTGGNVARFSREGAFLSLFATNLANPTAITVDSSGNVFVAAQAGGIRRYNSTGGFVQSYALGQANANFRGIAIAPDGTLIVSDAGNHVLWKFPIAGGSAFHFAGTFGNAGFADGATGVAKFNRPHQLAVSTNGVIVVADRGNHRIRAVSNDGVVSTLYGVDPATWEGAPPETLPGWFDGAAGAAELREPVGVAVSANNTVYDSEVFYSVIRKASGLTFPTNAVTNPGDPGGNPGGATTPNRISLGFASGEASSDFFGAPGQRFVAPVTLTVVPGARMYGLQFNLMVTNFPGSPVGNYSAGFDSTIYKPVPSDPTKFIKVPPQMYAGMAVNSQTQLVADGLGTTVINYGIPDPIWVNMIVTNGFGNFIGVGWLERFGETNLYDTKQHDLIRYSIPHDYLFRSENGRVVPGAFSFTIPPSSTIGDKYRVSVGRPSATGDGVASDAVIEAPDGSDSTLGIAAIRTLNIAVRKYLVGDVLPFRWFNAGDFGDNTILNNDMEQVHEMIAYGYNIPPRGSDMFNALDSCCVTADPTTGLPTGVDVSAPSNFQLALAGDINAIGHGDGVLTLEDFFVSFRRSLDPGLVNYERYWWGGQRVAYVTSNSFRGTAADQATASKKVRKPLVDTARMQEPITAKYIAGNVRASAGQSVQVPIDLQVTGPLSGRSLLLHFSVDNLDRGTPLQAPISFTASSAVGAPSFGGITGPQTFAATWFEVPTQLTAGTHRVGTVSFTIPATATADALYTVNITRAEVSAGLTRFPVTMSDGFIWMLDRANAPWSDEIPDAWRLQYFGSLMNILSAPDADADGDGVTNIDEYRTGTNPNDIGSNFIVKGSNVAGGVVLRWPSVAGKTYRLESASALNGATWTVVEDAITGTGGIIQRSQSFNAGQARFYRVNLVQ
ncbi:MAG TPA: hypothetical protein VM680_16465 [Verrucomicrobiae bacterium]|nr:hypothetical protein [Verrucomicrobiae bacterium]